MQNTDEKPKFRPYVPADAQMREFTLRAIVLGLILTGILGAANAYLGLKAGMTRAMSPGWWLLWKPWLRWSSLTTC